jgi:hypothetical protein
MLGRRVVPLAGIAWSFGVIALALQTGRLNERRSREAQAAPLDPLALATAILRASDRFSSTAVGYAGTTPNEVLAWRVIFHSANRDQVFTELLATASVPGQLYALTGLWFADSRDFARAAEQLRHVGGTVQTVRSCIISTELVASVVTQIEGGDWSREFLTGRVRPSVAP